jgi:hypothetical protein
MLTVFGQLVSDVWVVVGVAVEGICQLLADVVAVVGMLSGDWGVAIGSLVSAVAAERPLSRFQLLQQHRPNRLSDRLLSVYSQ